MAGVNEIVRQIAEAKGVERICENIAHHAMDADLKDLSQMVYLTLLEYDPDYLNEAWEQGRTDYIITRIVLNNYRSRTSPYYREIRRVRERTTQVGETTRLTDAKVQGMSRKP